MANGRPWEDFDDPVAATAQPSRPTEPQVGYGEDIAKGAAGGLGRGTSGLLGLPGDVAEYGARGIDWASRKIGGILGVDVKPREDRDPTYGSAAAKRNIESVTGPFYEPKTVPGQYASTIAEFAPAAAIPGGGGLAARAFNTVVPAVASETAGQVTKGTAAEPWARGIAGVAAGPAAAKIVTPTAAPSAIRQEAIDTFRRHEIPLTAGDKTGSKTIRMIESNAADMPFSAGRAAELNAKQAAAYDRAVTYGLYDPAELEARGVPKGVNLPDPRVKQAGPQSLSDEYTRLTQNPLRGNPDLLNRMARAESEYKRLVLPHEQTSNVENTRNSIINKLVLGRHQMAGDEYQSIRSQIGKRAQAAENPAEASALREMKYALDEAMARGLSQEDARAWALNNQRYANMKQTEGAVAAAGENLSPLRVAQSVRSGRAGQAAQGRGDLDELAKAGELLLRPLPNSQTAARMGWQNMFNLKSLLSTGGGAAAGSPFGLPGVVAGAALPHVVSRLAVSRPGQAYLGNQALPQNARDVIAQTLAQQAISQPSVVERNQREREEYERNRRSPTD